MVASTLLSVAFGALIVSANPVKLSQSHTDQIQFPKSKGAIATIHIPGVHENSIYLTRESLDRRGTNTEASSEPTSLIQFVRYAVKGTAICCHVNHTLIVDRSACQECSDVRNDQSILERESWPKPTITPDTVVNVNKHEETTKVMLKPRTNDFCCWIDGLFPTHGCNLYDDYRSPPKVESRQDKQKVCCWTNGLQVFDCHLCPQNTGDNSGDGVEIWQPTEVDGHLIKFSKRSPIDSALHGNKDICCIETTCFFCTSENYAGAQVWTPFAAAGKGNYKYGRVEDGSDASIQDDQTLCCAILQPFPFCVECLSAASATAAQLPAPIATGIRDQDIDIQPQDHTRCCVIVNKDLICDICPMLERPLTALNSIAVDELDPE